MKIINYADSWKYPPSILVRPEPENVWKFDSLKPKDANSSIRSDAGLIIERMKMLEDDADAMTNAATSNADQNTAADAKPENKDDL